MIFSSFQSRFRVVMDRMKRDTMRLLRSSYGLAGLGLVSFIESALPLPLLTDPFLVVYILADRTRVVRGVIVTVAASVLGGVAAYLLARAFFELIAVYYLTGEVGIRFYEIAGAFQQATFVMTLLGTLTPIPYTTVALLVGFIKGNLAVFIIGSLIGRGLRFTVVGYLTYHFGARALQLERKQILLLTGACMIMVLAYLFFRYVF